MGKASFKSIFEKRSYLKLKTLKMSWLATWFIFELIGVRAAPDISEPQALKVVSVQMTVYKTFIFCCVFHKKLYHIQVFDIRYE